MTYKETLDLITSTALSQPNVNSAVREFTDLNREDAVYSAVVIQDQEHRRNDLFMTYRWYIGYVDRLTSSEDNRDLIYSTGIQVLNNIINQIGHNTNLDIVSNQFITFEHRFTAYCAGVYTSIECTVPITDCYELYN